MMTMSTPPPLEHAGSIQQPVFLHVWGVVDQPTYERACAFIASKVVSVVHHGVAINPRDAFEPGGLVIPSTPWGDMPSGFGEHLARLGLNSAWITQAMGFEPRGTHIVHVRSRTRVEARIDPTRTTCDLIKPIGPPPEGVERIVDTLMRIITRLSVRVCTTQHQKMELLRSAPALFHAHHATSASALETAAAMMRR